MNVFLQYLQTNNLNIHEMSADEIIAAFEDCGSRRSLDLTELIESLPHLKKLKVLCARLEQVMDDYDTLPGSHVSDNDYSQKGYKSF